MKILYTIQLHIFNLVINDFLKVLSKWFRDLFAQWLKWLVNRQILTGVTYRNESVNGSEWIFFVSRIKIQVIGIIPHKLHMPPMMVLWWVDGKENVKSEKDEMNRRKVKNIGETKERERKKTSRFLPLPSSCLVLSVCKWPGGKLRGKKRSSLVKLLADDRKIRGILLLTGCCVSFLLQMVCVSLFSVKLSLPHNARGVQVFVPLGKRIWYI